MKRIIALTLGIFICSGALAWSEDNISVQNQNEEFRKNIEQLRQGEKAWQQNYRERRNEMLEKYRQEGLSKEEILAKMTEFNQEAR